MARKPRIHYCGALYHVIVKGNNGEKVFYEEIDKRKYLEIIARYKEKLGFRIYAFCIMDNHAHLLIEVEDVPLSRIMQRIQQVYTQWFNRKYERNGHVFQQRYKALLCNKESYLLQLIKYIHSNPIKANLKKGIEYAWSSHLYYIGKKKGDLVDLGNVLIVFSDDRKKAIKRYLQFMNQDQEVADEDIKEYELDLKKVEHQKQRMDEHLDIDEIIESICASEQVTISQIMKKTKVKKITDLRKAIVFLSEKYCNLKNKDLAAKLGLSPSMVSKIRSYEGMRTEYAEDIVRKWEKVNNSSLTPFK